MKYRPEMVAKILEADRERCDSFSTPERFKEYWLKHINSQKQPETLDSTAVSNAEERKTMIEDLLESIPKKYGADAF